MKQVTVVYRLHEGYWSAECPEVPELVAGDPSLTDLIDLVHVALRDFTGHPTLAITDVVGESADIG